MKIRSCIIQLVMGIIMCWFSAYIFKSFDNWSSFFRIGLMSLGVYFVLAGIRLLIIDEFQG